MKTKKLNLEDLKVESFVTSLENQNSNTIKGGISPGATPPITLSIISTIISAISVVTLCLDCDPIPKTASTNL